MKTKILGHDCDQSTLKHPPTLPSCSWVPAEGREWEDLWGGGRGGILLLGNKWGGLSSLWPDVACEACGQMSACEAGSPCAQLSLVATGLGALTEMPVPVQQEEEKLGGGG